MLVLFLRILPIKYTSIRCNENRTHSASVKWIKLLLKTNYILPSPYYNILLPLNPFEDFIILQFFCF